jgi:uncharacterized protein (TIGR02808 family)
MSTLESVIWHVLGYSAIPLIVLTGVFISTLIFFGLARLLGGGNKE